MPDPCSPKLRAEPSMGRMVVVTEALRFDSPDEPFAEMVTLLVTR